MFNKCYLILILIIINLSLFGCGKPSEEVIKTKDLLDKLQIRTEVGLNYSEYQAEMIEIKHQFSKIPKKYQKKEYYQKIKDSIRLHELALNFWDECYSSQFENNCSKKHIEQVVNEFPELTDKESLYLVNPGERLPRGMKANEKLVVKQLLSEVPTSNVPRINTQGFLSAIWQSSHENMSNVEF